LQGKYYPGGGGGYTEFQVTGIIEWGQKSKPKNPKLTPQKSHAEFSSLKNFLKGLNDIRRKEKKNH